MTKKGKGVKRENVLGWMLVAISVVLVLLAFIFLSGCASVTEGDRKLFHQNREAGALVEEIGQQPEVRQAGRDIRLNSEVLMDNLGRPKEVLPYSPQVSERVRVEAKEEHQQVASWLQIILSLLPWLGGITGIGSGVLSVLFLVQKWIANKKLMAVYQGVEKVVANVKGGNVLSADGMVDILRTAASAYNVYPEIKADLAKLRNGKE